jgi:transcriptional regulator with XRE-family HTH domain
MTNERLSDQLRRIIVESGVSRYQLARETGVQESALSRFVSGERGLTMDSIDKVAEALELEVVVKRRRVGTGSKRQHEGTVTRGTQMGNPRFSREQLWKEFLAVAEEYGDQDIDSLTGQSSHRIISLDDGRHEYEIEYGTKSASRATVTLEDLYALYCELYRNGVLSNKHMREHLGQILPGWRSWHAPGSAMFAILPLLDDKIVKAGARGGELHVPTL